MNLGYEIAGYANNAESYIRHQSLRRDFFASPDHIAIKAANAIHFDALIKQIKKGDLGLRVEDIVRIEMDDRKIDTAFLAGPLLVGSLWKVNLLEIMEPRPEKAGKDKVGVDHMEFFQEYLSPIEHYFLDRGIIPAFEPKPRHNTLCLTFGPDNNEMKFTDRGLREVAIEDLDAGRAVLL